MEPPTPGSQLQQFFLCNAVDAQFDTENFRDHPTTTRPSRNPFRTNGQTQDTSCSQYQIVRNLMVGNSPTSFRQLQQST